MTPERHGAALVRDVVVRADDPDDPLTTIDALELVTPADVELILHPSGPVESSRVIAVAVGASPGVASGAVALDAGRALDLFDRGRPYVLVRPATSIDDEPALARAAGVLTASGGIASHAAILARGRGIPAVCGADALRISAESFSTADGTVVHQGDEISIDGSTGEVRLGAASIAPVDAATDGLAELDQLLGWADELRAGSLGVWANADTAEDAARARRAGAEGIGLCRAERLLLGPDRLPSFRQLLASDHAVDGGEVADQVRVGLQHDLERLLAEMDGLPVTVRLLDAPLDDIVAGSGAGAGGRRAEQNPALGVRGARALLLRPDLLRLQVQASIDAVAGRLDAGGEPRLRLMVPFVSIGTELAMIRRLIDAVVAESDRGIELPVGVMIETPRSALISADLVGTADFLSFGTNDLTQLTFGLGRDDTGPVLERYVGSGVLAADPFATIDVDGVGELVALGVERARAVDPAVEISVCGEHGGDQASIAFFRSLGVDHVSCSPFRVPVARLAAARSVLGVT